MIFGSDPADPFSWRGTHPVLDFAQSAPFSCELMLQWELWVMAQEAMLGETAYSKLRRILGRRQTYGLADIAACDSAICYNRISREKNAQIAEAGQQIGY